MASKSLYGIAAGDVMPGLSSTDLNLYLDDYVALGAGWLRFDFDWSDIQSGGSSSYNWTNYDNVVNAARARNIEVLGTIAFVPTWELPAGHTDSYNSPPNSNTDYATFCTAVVNRYAPLGVHTWEIWNEPNLANRFTVANYTNLLQLAYAAIKAADATATVLSGGMSPAVTNGTNTSPIDWLTGIYSNGGKNYLDAVAHHPYSYASGLFPLYARSNAWSQMADTPVSLRSIMVANGDSAKKIWATEFGAPTNGSAASITETQQATLVTDAYSLFQSFSWSGPMFWYSYHDKGTATTTEENFFGLVRYDFTHKPSYAAYQTVARSGLNCMSYYLSVILADSPQAYYRLDEATGTTAVDASGNGYHATLSGTFTLSQPGAITGDTDNGISMGASGTLTLPYTLNYTTFSAFSLEFWTTGATSNWEHIVVTATGTTTTVYRNGTVYTPDTTAPIEISQILDWAGGYISSSLDEVAIYNTALTSAQVLHHYQVVYTRTVVVRTLVRTQVTKSAKLRTLVATKKTVSTVLRTLIRTQKTASTTLRAIIRGITKVSSIRTLIRTKNTRSTPLRTLVRTLVSKSAPLRTLVRTQVSNSVVLRAIIRGITRLVVLRVLVRTLITKSVPVRTLIRTQVSKSFVFRTLVRTQRTLSTGVRASIRGITRLTAVRFLLRTQRTLSTALRTLVRTQVSKSTSLRALVRTQRTLSTGLRSVIQGVTKGVVLRLLARTQRTLSTPLRTAVRTLVSKVSALRIPIRTQVGKVTSLRSVIRGITRYTVVRIMVTAHQVTALSGVRTLVRTGRTLTTGLRSVIRTIGKSTPIRVLLRSQRTLTSKVRTLVHTARTLTTPLRTLIKTQISKSTPVRFLVRTIRTLSSPVRTLIKTLVSKSTPLRALVRTQKNLTTGLRAVIRTLNKSIVMRTLVRTQKNLTTSVRTLIRTQVAKSAVVRTLVTSSHTLLTSVRTRIRTLQSLSTMVRTRVRTLSSQLTSVRTRVRTQVSKTSVVRLPLKTLQSGKSAVVRFIIFVPGTLRTRIIGIRSLIRSLTSNVTVVRTLVRTSRKLSVAIRVLAGNKHSFTATLRITAIDLVLPYTLTSAPAPSNNRTMAGMGSTLPSYAGTRSAAMSYVVDGTPLDQLPVVGSVPRPSMQTSGQFLFTAGTRWSLVYTHPSSLVLSTFAPGTTALHTLGFSLSAGEKVSCTALVTSVLSGDGQTLMLDLVIPTTVMVNY